jgi:transketolase
MIIANTKKGKGASLMEDQRLWHYRVPSGNDLEAVSRELNGSRVAESKEVQTSGGY